MPDGIGLLEAVWRATAEYVRRVLEREGVSGPVTAPFLLALADRPGDWMPLAVLADKLDEDEVSHPIRELLPRCVAGAVA